MSGTGLRLSFVVVLLVVAGCVAAPVADHAPVADPDPTDPAFTDRPLGVVDGYAYDDALGFQTAEALTDDQLDAVVARTMARVEYLRGLQFEEPVPVEVISREEFRDQQGRDTSPAYATWENQLWRALFHVDEHTDAQSEFDAIYGGAVQGYYSTADGSVVLVSDDPDRHTVDRLTLAHELLHALQDQHFGISWNSSTIDASLAGQGIIEGDARYLEHRYEERCVSGEWECLERPSTAGAGAGSVNLGMLLTIYHPYSDGQAFVHHVRERGGWEAVNAVYDAHPTSTTQVIHPERYPDEQPVGVAIPDRSADDWSRFTDVPERDDPTQTVGEAALYTTFWANGVIDSSHLFTADDSIAEYNYSHPITNGWRGDTLVPYRHDDGERFGFVFESEWESEEDAVLFAEAYAELLSRQGAEERGSDTFRIADGESYAGGYHVNRSGTTVTVVHAPSVEELDAVHAPQIGVSAGFAGSSPVVAVG